LIISVAVKIKELLKKKRNYPWPRPGRLGVKSLFLNQETLNPGYKLVASPPHKPGLLPRWLGEKGVNIIRGRRDIHS
jgi:hypothetical protein